MTKEDEHHGDLPTGVIHDSQKKTKVGSLQGYARSYHTGLKHIDRWTVLKTLFFLLILYWLFREAFQSDNSSYFWPGMFLTVIFAFPYMKKLVRVDKINIWEVPPTFFEKKGGIWRKNPEAGLVGMYEFPQKKISKEGWEFKNCVSFYTNRNKMTQVRVVERIDWVNRIMYGTKRAGLSPIDFEMNELLMYDLMDTLDEVMKKNIIHGEKVEILSLQRLGQMVHFWDDILSLRTVTGLKKITDHKKTYGIEKVLGDLREDPIEKEEGESDD